MVEDEEMQLLLPTNQDEPRMVMMLPLLLLLMSLVTLHYQRLLLRPASASTMQSKLICEKADEVSPHCEPLYSAPIHELVELP